MRDRQTRNRDRIYSIPIELDERNIGWTMTTYPGLYREGASTNNIANINPIYSHETDRIPFSVESQARESSRSNILEKDHSEEAPPSYYSLFRSKQ